MRSSLPAADELFFAETEAEWSTLVQKHHQRDSPAAQTRPNPPSLATYYGLFLRHDALELLSEITPLHLRLLLCTIQTQVIQFSQTNRLATTASDVDGSSSGMSNFASLRQEELQTMLIKWYILHQRVVSREKESMMTIACKLIYHLVCLELLICFSDVQLIAGREGAVGAKPLIPQLRRLARSPSWFRALAHVGQLLKVLQHPDWGMLRPIWWPVALSRVALILWAYGIGLKLKPGSSRDPHELGRDNPVMIALNDPSEEFSPNGRVVQPGEGLPCLYDSRGCLIPMREIPHTLRLCLDLLEEGKDQSLPICVEVHRFLQDIMRYDFPWTKS